jgi:catechol 2,3-dioxygenase-like lactoylglutathione lyase family enzyme
MQMTPDAPWFESAGVFPDSHTADRPRLDKAQVHSDRGRRITVETTVDLFNKVKPEDFETSIDYLRKNGVEDVHNEDRNEGVYWGPQAYFHDPDGNEHEIYAGPGAKQV